ncbi:MAG: radical SAM protein [Chthoniobacter sp.]|uniref:radical SAM protein n=1 Tax=Chthoniobacter sp. TaxID=2510640 RepID=UPI0032A63B2F
MNVLVLSETLLKRTQSRCPICHADCPAEVWKVGDAKQQRVMLRRRCVEHGEAEACIASDARFYWLAQGEPENACCGGNACAASDGAVRGTLGRNAAGVAELENGKSKTEKLSTCLALIEIVNSCNLACPTCFADSPRSSAVDAVPLGDLQRRIQGVIDRKGGIEILQLSGGEPTLHPQFCELLAWCHANPGIDYVLLNTNGVRLATDDAFLDAVGKTFCYGKFQLYLQFDGPQESGQRNLRGADLRDVRRRAIERCGALNIPITLAMTVTPENLGHLWAAVEYGLQFPHVRGVAFQPAFGSGRVSGFEFKVSGSPQRGQPETRAERSETPVGAVEANQKPETTHLNTADIILAAVEQAGGRLRYDDFTPLPCGDPNCATIGYLLKTGDGATRSISEFIDFAQVQGFLRDKIRYRLEDLLQCGCESEPLGELLKQFELDETHTFRLFIKPFMDAWTWDQDRIDRCCTHVIRPDGQLDSFCRYYALR